MGEGLEVCRREWDCMFHDTSYSAALPSPTSPSGAIADSDAASCLTLAELERWLVLAVTGPFDDVVHGGLGEPPLETTCGRGGPYVSTTSATAPAAVASTIFPEGASLSSAPEIGSNHREREQEQPRKPDPGDPTLSATPAPNTRSGRVCDADRQEGSTCCPTDRSFAGAALAPPRRFHRFGTGQP